MPLILHHKDPSNMVSHDRSEVEDNTNLIDWMTSQWADQNEMSGGLEYSVFLNQREIFKSDDDNPDIEALNIVINGNDVVSIVNRPAATIIIIALVVVAVAVAISLALAPSLPGEAGEVTESPNNRLNAARNSFRPGEARPEIFGKVVSYPDFIQPTYFEYINNLKIVYELGYIGEGQFEIGESRNGETPFSSIPGSSFRIFQPGETIPENLKVAVRPAEPVDGQSLLAPDDESIVQIGEIDTITKDSENRNVLTLIEDSTLASDLALTVGTRVTLSLGIAFNTGNEIAAPIVTTEIVSLSVLNERTVITVDSTTDIVQPPSSLAIFRVDDNGNIDDYVGYFEIPGRSAEEVWFNWQMPQGIRSESGKRISIDVEFEIESLNSEGIPTGQTFIKRETISGSTGDAQFRTTKFAPSEFPSMTRSQYRGRLRRLTPQFDGSAAQQIKIEQMLSVTPYSNLDNSTGTVISWERRATTFALSASGNRNNLDVTRMLPTYNRSTGVYDVNNLTATRSFADAAAYTLIVASGRNPSTVNLAELYAIFDGLPHAELGYFDFTFDNKNVGLGERIESICNAARVNPFRDGAIWRFTRDEARPFRTTMFNRRVTVGNSSKQSILLQRPDDKDSVALTYVDPEFNVERILYRRVNSAGEIVSDGQGKQPLEIKLAGCRNFFQAWNRVELEMRRIIYQRLTVRDTVLRDGLTVGLLDRVGWVDPNDVTLFDGEILGFNGNVYDTSERFEPEDGESYLVYITDNQGRVSNTVEARPRNDTEFGFIADGLSGVYLADSAGDQLGSCYFIANASDITAGDFQVTTRTPQSDNKVDLELVEYVPQMYERDNAAPPQPEVILPSSIASSAFDETPDDVTATLTVGSNGRITTTNGLDIGFIASPSAGVGANFEVRLNRTSGAQTTGENVNEWIRIDENRSWSVTRIDDANGSDQFIGQLQIRDRTFTENIDSTSVTITATVGGELSLPATINVEDFGFGESATAEIRFLSNGEYRGTTVLSGSYTTISNNVGAMFEIMATVTSGNTANLSGSIGTWQPLSGERAWSLFAPRGFDSLTTVLNIQIRAIADNANIVSSAVTLNVETEL